MPLKVTQKQRLLYRPQAHRLLLKKPRSPLASNRTVDDDNEDFEIQDLYVAYRRPIIVDDDGDEPLNNYILDRLQDARMLALAMLK